MVAGTDDPRYCDLSYTCVARLLHCSEAPPINYFQRQALQIDSSEGPDIDGQVLSKRSSILALSEAAHAASRAKVVRDLVVRAECVSLPLFKQGRSMAETFAYGKIALRSVGECDPLLVHVDEKISVARADAAIALYDPCVQVVERRGQRDGVAHKFAVARGLVLCEFAG